MTDKQYIVEEHLLIEKLVKGDTKTFDLLFDRYSRKIYGFALRYLKSEVDAEGVVQDVFLYIWKSRKNIKTDTNFRSYLFTITINLIKKVFRREAYLSKFKMEVGVKLSDNSADEQIEYASLLVEVDKLIDKLPERRRNIFIKSRKPGMSSKEIAEELGITPGTVDNQISEALKFLRTKIDKKRLLKYLDSVKYSGEHKYLIELFAELENHREFSEFLKSDWDEYISRNENVDKDLSDILRRVHDEIENIEKSESWRKRFIRTYSKIAAILLLPLVVAGVYYIASIPQIKELVNMDSFSEVYAYTNSRVKYILPGSLTVWITLGSSIRFYTAYAGNWHIEIKGNLNGVEGFVDFNVFMGDIIDLNEMLHRRPSDTISN